ncbi:inositol 1,4,5-triphosphate receptor associated 2 [Amia ocellicauda]|uniref:inositol 1,4,5-triphosphate receptor associated 2 n=1 Tax=Amia ocellicauda TaxID=2972642 RepID=UPI003464B3E6
MSDSPLPAPPMLQRSHSLSSLPPSWDPQADWTPDCDPHSPTQGRMDGQRLGTKGPKDAPPPSKEELKQQQSELEACLFRVTAGGVQSPDPAQEPPLSRMADQAPSPMALLRSNESVDRQGDSEDSMEEPVSEIVLSTSWDDLSILERLGLNSTQLTEEEVESAFAQLSLAFRCDQYTLKRRLQAEERARDVAEENIHQELDNGRTTLEALKTLCVDSKRSKILHKLEQSLDILSSTVERISNTAEVLGAVHQEARVSRAVELMVVHVENLKRRHARDHAELEETKRMVQRNSRNRQLSETRDEGDLRPKIYLRTSQQHSARRRVSIAVIPKQTQLLQASDSRSSENGKGSTETDALWTAGDNARPSVRQPAFSKDDSADSSNPQGLCDPTPLLAVGCPADSPDEKEDSVYFGSPAQDSLRRRGRSRGAPQVGKADERESDEEFSDCDNFTMDTCALSSEERPLLPWLWQCRWFLLWLLLMGLSCTLLVGILLWRLRIFSYWA